MAKEYAQYECLDYLETLSLIVKMVAIRCLLILTIVNGWFLHQLDANNTFLHGDFAEEFYIIIPLGFGTKGKSRVCRFCKSLSRLKQVHCQWFAKFFSTLLQYSFTQSKNDDFLFTHTYGSFFIAFLVYVDNIIIAINDTDGVYASKELLANRFKLNDLGYLKYFLRFEIARTTKGIFVSYRKYAFDILTDTNFFRAKLVKFLMKQNLRLSNLDGNF